MFTLNDTCGVLHTRRERGGEGRGGKKKRSESEGERDRRKRDGETEGEGAREKERYFYVQDMIVSDVGLLCVILTIRWLHDSTDFRWQSA
jgi:hypothetical protein